MSRSGYVDDYDGYSDYPELDAGRWRGMVASAMRGRRGQAFFRDLLAALDEMPEKRLIADALERDGEVCAIGALGRKRGVDMGHIDPEDYESVAGKFNIAAPLAQEVVYMNDEWLHYDYKLKRNITPEERWQKMRDWVASKIKSDAAP